MRTFVEVIKLCSGDVDSLGNNEGNDYENFLSFRTILATIAVS